MPRLQKVTEKVFAEIAETPQKKGAYNTFIEIDNIIKLPEDELLKSLKEVYNDIITEQKETISTLAAIEEVIIQIRCKSVINSELRLSLSRNYIYARSIFYRRGTQINDIRVIAGVTEDHGDDLSTLIKNEAFRDICISKLQAAMTKEINNNVNKIEFITIKTK